MTSKKHHVLFVDDEANVLASLQRALHHKSDQWKMSFTSDIDEAIALTKSDCPQVIVSDLRMPRMSGIEMIQEMRQVMSSPAIFMLLTGNGDMASAIGAINDAQVFRFLTKPCPADELIYMIEDALNEFQLKDIEDNTDDSDMKDAALSLLSPAIAIVDSKAASVYVNESATDIFALKDGLFLDAAGIVRASKSDISKKIADAISHASSNQDAPAQFFSIPRQSHFRDLMLVVLPSRKARVALLITDPERTTVLSPECLLSLFELTKSEALIAHTLANGGSIEDAAAASGIAISSARTYLKRIFSKTGVCRQSDLVQLILTTPAPLIRQPSDIKVA